MRRNYFANKKYIKLDYKKTSAKSKQGEHFTKQIKLKKKIQIFKNFTD